MMSANEKNKCTHTTKCFICQKNRDNRPDNGRLKGLFFACYEALAFSHTLPYVCTVPISVKTRYFDA